MRKILASLLLLFAVGTVNAELGVYKTAELATPDCPRIETCFSPMMDCSKVVIGQLDSAKKTLDLALYSLTLDSIAQAIIDAHKRGVKVRVVIDRTQAGLKVADDEKLEETRR